MSSKRLTVKRTAGKMKSVRLRKGELSIDCHSTVTVSGPSQPPAREAPASGCLRAANSSESVDRSDYFGGGAWQPTSTSTLPDVSTPAVLHRFEQKTIFV